MAMFASQSDYTDRTGFNYSSTSTKTRSTGISQVTDITTYSNSSRLLKQQNPGTISSDQKSDNVSTLLNDLQSHSSVDTYASTIASTHDVAAQHSLVDTSRGYEVYDSDAIASTPKDFAKLFPSTRRILLQHDDSTSDGYMNIRLDAEFTSRAGERGKMTLFHLRMTNLHERQFSLRRYCRESGREVCNSRRKYVKPLPASYRRKTQPLSKFITTHSEERAQKPPPYLQRIDSGYASQEDGESEDEMQLLTNTMDIAATIPTKTIKLEFANYAQVEVQRNRDRKSKSYDFEYWGVRYTWRREVNVDDGEKVYSYELINLNSGQCIAYIMPDRLGKAQAASEKARGGWVPPSSLKLTAKSVSDDVGDVIIATGLITMVDDCIKRRERSRSLEKSVHEPEDVRVARR